MAEAGDEGRMGRVVARVGEQARGERDPEDPAHLAQGRAGTRGDAGLARAHRGHHAVRDGREDDAYAHSGDDQPADDPPKPTPGMAAIATHPNPIACRAMPRAMNGRLPYLSARGPTTGPMNMPTRGAFCAPTTARSPPKSTT